MRRPRVSVVALFACLLCAVMALSCSDRTPAVADAPGAGEATGPQPSRQDVIKRGEMLVIGGACHDCHTPKVIGKDGLPEADMTRILAGHPESAGVPAPFTPQPGSPWVVHTNEQLTAWSGQWGVSFAINLTPDENTGLGIWTEDMFLKAMKSGRHMGTSRPILPPMPWMWYGKLSDDDLKAIFAYVQSIPAIRNRVPIPLGPDGKPIEQPQ